MGRWYDLNCKYNLIINEIAEILHKKPATVGTLLARGRERLKAMMIGGFDDE